MLIDIDTGKVKDRVPFQHDFDALRGRLSGAEFDAMVTRINELIDEAGSEIATAGWLPGSDWTQGRRRFGRVRRLRPADRPVETANGLPHGPSAIVAAIVLALVVYPISRLVRFVARR